MEKGVITWEKLMAELASQHSKDTIPVLSATNSRPTNQEPNGQMPNGQRNNQNNNSNQNNQQRNNQQGNNQQGNQANQKRWCDKCDRLVWRNTIHCSACKKCHKGGINECFEKYLEKKEA